MKKITTIGFVLVIVAACNVGNNEKTITGTYARETADEYGRVWDTVYISKAASSGETVYAITEKIKVQHLKMLDGMTNPFEYKVKKWSATYQKDNHTLYVQEKGLTYAVETDKGMITDGQVTFTRIKE